MYIVEIRLRGKQISSAFCTELKDVQRFAMDWSRGKHDILGYRIPFDDFEIFVYDVSKPCPSHHIEKPKFIYY